MRYYVFMLSLLICSCSNSYKLDTEDFVDVRNYEVFTFRLCENINEVGNARFFECDEDCVTAPKAIESIENTQVREELYLLVSRTTNDVIYLTTKTDRSFNKTPDIFNTEAHNDYVLANDLENVYFGQIEGEKIVFYCKEETLTLSINRTIKSCKILIESALSETKADSPINNREVVLNTIYNVPIAFNLTNRILAIKAKKLENYDIINTISLKNGRIRFKGAIEEISKSQRRRLKYHPNFENIK